MSRPTPVTPAHNGTYALPGRVVEEAGAWCLCPPGWLDGREFGATWADLCSVVRASYLAAGTLDASKQSCAALVEHGLRHHSLESEFRETRTPR